MLAARTVDVLEAVAAPPSRARDVVRVPAHADLAGIAEQAGRPPGVLIRG